MTTKHANHKTREKKTEQAHGPAPTPFQQNQQKIDALVQSVREAFQANGFAIPGDIAIQVRNMAALTPHPTFPPEQINRAA